MLYLGRNSSQVTQITRQRSRPDCKDPGPCPMCVLKKTLESSPYDKGEARKRQPRGQMIIAERDWKVGVVWGNPGTWAPTNIDTNPLNKLLAFLWFHECATASIYHLYRNRIVIIARGSVLERSARITLSKNKKPLMHCNISLTLLLARWDEF